jgi:tetratricopeptide (TPR) repeat protein
MNNFLLVCSIISFLFACGDVEQTALKSTNTLIAEPNESYAESRMRLNQILEASPDSLQALLESASLALEHYDYSLAYADAARAFRLDSSSNSARMMYALSIINQGNRTVSDISRAQSYLQMVVQNEGKNEKAMVGLANTYALQQDFDEARIWIDKVLDRSPKFFDAHVLKGSMYKVLSAALNGEDESQSLSRAYMDSAINTYSRVSQYYPDKPEIYIELGILFQQLNNERCVDQFFSAVQLEPENIDYKYALAYAYGLFGQERLAMKVYTEMQELDSLYSEAYCQMGQIYQKKYGELDSALNMYREVVSIDPSHIDAYVNMGVIYAEKKAYTRALKSYSKALSILPEDRGPFMPLSTFIENQNLAREYADEIKDKL